MLELSRLFSDWIDPPKGKRSAAELPVRTRSTCVTPVEGHWNKKGDLSVGPKYYFPFYVEAKFREGWNMDGIWESTWPVWEWFALCCKLAATQGEIPLLVFRRARRQNVVMTGTWVTEVASLTPCLTFVDHSPSSIRTAALFPLSTLLAIPYPKVQDWCRSNQVG
jgi:hypothetical protein